MRVVLNKPDEEVILVEDIGTNQIVIYKNGSSFYKLHKVDFSKGLYAFVSIRNSGCWATGEKSWKDILSEITEEHERMSVFNNIKDFSNWLAEELK